MTDFTVHAARWCKENVQFVRLVPGKRANYIVTYGRSPGPYEMNWHCTCDSFRFGGGKECKHIIASKPLRCTYGEEAAIGSPTDMGETCPKCFGPTVGIMYLA